MKTGRSLQDLAIELDRQAKAKRDYIVNTRHLDVSVIPSTPEKPQAELLSMVSSNAEEVMNIGRTAHSQVATRLAIPSRYYHRMREEAPDLWARNVNHWLHDKPQTRMVRTLDDSCRAFLSSSYRRLDNFDLTQVVLPMVLPGIAGNMHTTHGTQVTSCEVTDDYLHLKFAHTLLTGEVMPGDVVQAGFGVRNSEVGLGTYEVFFFLLRLVCSNGMKLPFGYRKVHLGRSKSADQFQELFTDKSKALEDATVFSQTRDVIAGLATKDKFNETLAMLKESTKDKLEGDVPAAVKVLGNQVSLTADEESNVLTHLIEGGDLSKWGVANAVTRAAEDVESYDRASELEAIGGKVVLMAKPSWQQIAEATSKQLTKTSN